MIVECHKSEMKKDLYILIVLGLIVKSTFAKQQTTYPYPHPSVTTNVCLVVDNLPYKFHAYGVDCLVDLCVSPLDYYVIGDTSLLSKTSNIQLIYDNDRNISVMFFITKDAQSGYLSVNKKVYDYLVKEGVEYTRHVYRYYINDLEIDKDDKDRLLQLQEQQLLQVNICFGLDKEEVIVRIKTSI